VDGRVICANARARRASRFCPAMTMGKRRRQRLVSSNAIALRNEGALAKTPTTGTPGAYCCRGRWSPSRRNCCWRR
jgi:hypothetical protein